MSPDDGSRLIDYNYIIVIAGSAKTPWYSAVFYLIGKLSIAALYDDIKAVGSRYPKAKNDIKKEDLEVL